ncbi:hypothetical protein CL656_00070 [bacterium]|nr:hypothetical protein [bacterium]|tara:strand:- start:4742 stop:6088 length:1347 start_codon:yes stop_codon:yes gene_type:complete
MNFYKIIFIVFTFLNFSKAYALPPTPKINVNKIDTKILKIAKPATINYIMVPIVGMVDTFWVSKLGSTTDLAAVGSGDQIFYIYYSLMAFLPIIITPEISKLYNKNKNDEISNIINISGILSIILGSFGIILYFKTNTFANFFINQNSNIYSKAIQYLKVRSIAMPFCLINSVIFSILRGMSSYDSAIKINIITQFVNLILDPFLMMKYNLKGVAFASVLSEILCSIAFIKLLFKKNIIKPNIYSFKYKTLQFLRLGVFIQMKYLLINMLYITINKRLLFIDNTGNQLAAHIVMSKFLSITDILYRGLSTTATTIIPIEIINYNDDIMRKRLYYWANIIAIFQSFMFLNLRFVIKHFTSDPIIINICKKLLITTTIYQYLDGFNTIQEGILQGYQKFKLSSTVSFITTIPLIYFLSKSNNIYNLWKVGTSILFFKTIMLYIISNNKKI